MLAGFILSLTFSSVRGLLYQDAGALEFSGEFSGSCDTMQRALAADLCELRSGIHRVTALGLAKSPVRPLAYLHGLLSMPLQESVPC